jgi:hypothetical protein
MAGNGRRCRSRWDNAADVAQTVRAGAAQEPHEPPHQRAAHRFAQARRGATEGGSGRSPIVERGPVAETEPWSPNALQTASANRWCVSARIGLPQPPSRLSGES